MNQQRSDIFRFMTVRPPQRAEDDGISTNDDSNGAPSVLLRTLRAVRSNPGAAEEMQKLAKQFIDSDGNFDTRYVTSLSELSKDLSELEAAIGAIGADIDPNQLRDLVNKLSLDANDICKWKSHLVDSLCASLVYNKGRDRDQNRVARIERALRILLLLENSFLTSDSGEIRYSDFLKRTLVLPKGVFPVPISEKESKRRAKLQAEHREKFLEALDRSKKLEARMLANKAAVSELVAAYRDDVLQAEASKRDNGPRDDKGESVFNGILQKTSRWLGLGPSVTVSRSGNFAQRAAISDKSLNKLTEETRKRISAVSSKTASFHIPTVVEALERDTRDASSELYVGGMLDTVVRLGQDFLTAGPVYGNVFELGKGSYRVPGRCLIAPPDDDNDVDSDLPIGDGRYESLGIIDLMVTRQKLLRYEVGEIAHIENVLQSETRIREHRKLNRTEEFESIETERTMETEHDLESTERFEMQRESERTIDQDSSRYAGLTVSGSYGFSVTFSASAGFSSSTSTSESNRLASSYSKDVTERSVQRIQESIREKRSRLKIEEVEVVNTHSFTNVGQGSENITGIYRWIDKVYEAQLYNYGKREVIEVMIPEPAALIRHFATNAPKQGIAIPRPMEPGYCSPSTGVFQPLEPKHITEDQYMFWVSKYNVEDVSPPPAKFQVLGVAVSQADSGKENKAQVGAANNSIKVPPGYRAERGWLMKTNVGFGENARLTVLIGNKSFKHADELTLNSETGVVPIAIGGYGVPSFAITVEIECLVTDEFMQAWQIKTYNAILNKYQELKAEYDQSILGEEDAIAGIEIEGRNPIENRNIERRELKRAAISQLTGQTYNNFDAMRKGVPPYGYPEADGEEAWLEGQYVRFLEQGFEWENMQYLFYPYYWGRKDDWPIISQIEDVDSVYQSFLQAGFARVNIPVRPGFESAVNTFLSTGVLPWRVENEGAVISEDTETAEDEETAAIFLSIEEEMRAQQGFVYTKSSGTISLVDDGAKRNLRGQGTDFSDDEIDRDITFLGETYRIIAVDVASQKIRIDQDVKADTVENAKYSVGAKAVEAPWSIIVPTNLVALGDGTDIVGLRTEITQESGRFD